MTAMAALVAVLAISGCGKDVPDKLDYGTVTESVYQNKYFGMSMVLPEGWHVQDAAAKKRLMETGKRIASGDDKNLKAAMEASEDQTVNLLTVFKYKVGSPVPFNPGVICLAEKVSHLPGVKGGKDYLFHTKKALTMSQLKATFPTAIHSRTLGGVAFDILDAEMRVGDRVVQQQYYAAVMRGYALVFVISFSTESEAESLKEILGSLAFKST
jgi:hypothetical protein